MPTLLVCLFFSFVPLAHAKTAVLFVPEGLSIETVAPEPAMATSTTATTTWSLPLGEYFYRMTELTADGETGFGYESYRPVTVTATDQHVIVTWEGDTKSISYDLYRTNVSGDYTGDKFIATVTMGPGVPNEFIDIGLAATAKTPPATSTTPTVTLSSEEVALTGVVVIPDGLTDLSTSGTQNAVPLPESNGYRYTGLATIIINGIVAPTTARELTLFNASSFNITIAHLNTAAVAADRITTDTALPITAPPRRTINLKYDTIGATWRVLSRTGSTTGGGDIISLNGLTDATQLFDVEVGVGTQPAIVSSGNTHTFQYPLAGIGVTAGLIDNDTQDIDGEKTFKQPVKIEGDEPLVFEGLTVDGLSTKFEIEEPTTLNTYTFRNISGTVAVLSDIPSSLTEKSFMRVQHVGATIPVFAGSVLNFNTITHSRGTNISYDTVAGTFTLQPGQSYRLMGDGSISNGSTAETVYQWHDVTGEASIPIGTAGDIFNAYAPGYARQSYAEAVITPSVETLVQLKVIYLTGSTELGDIGSRQPNAFVQEL